MTIWGVLSLALRVFGLSRWAEQLWAKHEATIKGRSDANAPVTDQEEADDLLK